MDGGRVLRAVPVWPLGYARATELAASRGRAVALLLGAVGVLRSPMLLLAALFVWLASDLEAGAVRMHEAPAGLPARAGMMTDFHAFDPRATVAGTASMASSTAQRDFPVVVDDEAVGLITRARLLSALAGGRELASVSDVMRTDVQRVPDEEPLDVVVDRWRDPDAVPVEHGSRRVGLLTNDHLRDVVDLRYVGNGA